MVYQNSIIGHKHVKETLKSTKQKTRSTTNTLPYSRLWYEVFSAQCPKYDMSVFLFLTSAVSRIYNW